MFPIRYQRLYNSILFSVLANKDEDQTTFVLAKYTSSENERYPAKKGIGMKETSSKATIKSEEDQYGNSIDIDIKEALADMSATVRKVMLWIKNTKG